MTQFDHEKLNVYQASVRFVAWSSEILAEIPKSSSVHNQLDRASTSIPLNLAEGNGKSRPADRCRFFDMARGSAACLDVLVAKSLLDDRLAEQGKVMLLEIVAMIVGLIRANSPDRDV